MAEVAAEKTEISEEIRMIEVKTTDDEEMKQNSKETGKKRISFQETLSVKKVPGRERYKRENLFEELWWSHKQITVARMSFLTEATTVMRKNGCTMEGAKRKLHESYNDQLKLFTHVNLHTDTGPDFVRPVIQKKQKPIKSSNDVVATENKEKLMEINKKDEKPKDHSDESKTNHIKPSNLIKQKTLNKTNETSPEKETNENEKPTLPKPQNHINPSDSSSNPNPVDKKPTTLVKQKTLKKVDEMNTKVKQKGIENPMRKAKSMKNPISPPLNPEIPKPSNLKNDKENIETDVDVTTNNPSSPKTMMKRQKSIKPSSEPNNPVPKSNFLVKQKTLKTIEEGLKSEPEPLIKQKTMKKSDTSTNKTNSFVKQKTIKKTEEKTKTSEPGLQIKQKTIKPTETTMYKTNTLTKQKTLNSPEIATMKPNSIVKQKTLKKIEEPSESNPESGSLFDRNPFFKVTKSFSLRMNSMMRQTSKSFSTDFSTELKEPSTAPCSPPSTASGGEKKEKEKGLMKKQKTIKRTEGFYWK